MSTDVASAYIIASNKEWHRTSFEALKEEYEGDWYSKLSGRSSLRVIFFSYTGAIMCPKAYGRSMSACASI